MATIQDLTTQLNAVNDSLTKVAADSATVVALVTQLQNAQGVPDAVMGIVQQISDKTTAIDAQLSAVANPPPVAG